MNPALPGGATTADTDLDDASWSSAARVGYAFVPYGRMQQGRDEAPNPSNLAIDVHLATLQLVVAAPTATSLDVQLPAGTLVTTQLDTSTSDTGIGDLEARLRQSLARWIGGPVAPAVALGIVAPTGPYVPRTGLANLPPEASYLTLGRGVPWLLAEADTRLRVARTSLFAGLTARIPLARTTDELDWGSELRVTLSAQHRIIDRLALLAATDVQWRDQATEPDPFTGERAMSANAGGWQWAISPGVAFSATSELTIIAGARIPIFSDVVGNQLVPELGAFAAVSYARSLSSSPSRASTSSKVTSAYRPTAGQITVVDYWATWCTPCTEISRVLESARARWPDVHIVKIDATEWPGDGAPPLPEGSEGLPVVEIFDARGNRHALLRGQDALRVVDVVDALRTSSGRK